MKLSQVARLVTMVDLKQKLILESRIVQELHTDLFSYT